MATSATGMALRHLRDLFSSGTVIGHTDGQLLTRYATCNDGSAFEALVTRHGPMVVATCRAVLKHEHDIEDAFQSTFLVLARKAGSVRADDALGGWLHRVAYRIAVQAKIEAKRRRRHESEAAAMGISDATRPGLDLDLCSILHAEIERLPERERLPVVLVDLEGLSYEQAAGRLRWTVPALCYRLAKARKRLRERLTRRGVTADSLGVVMASSGTAATAALPASWIRAAVAVATGGPVPAAVAALTQTDHQGDAHDPTEDRFGGRPGSGRIRLDRSRGSGSGTARGAMAPPGATVVAENRPPAAKAPARHEPGCRRGPRRLDDRGPRPRRRSRRQARCAGRSCGPSSSASIRPHQARSRGDGGPDGRFSMRGCQSPLLDSTPQSATACPP